MLLLGIDVGTSSIKVSVVDSENGVVLAAVSFPEVENKINSPMAGWAEQSPETWWEQVQHAILLANSKGNYNPKDIGAIGISYQMHGLVIIDKQHNVLRPSIIWCDSRAVGVSEAAYNALGHEYSLSHFLNSPGNFTASKLAWVKANEPTIFEKIYKAMLPGDYINLCLTGEINTTISALSEGVFWDFKENNIAKSLLNQFGISEDLLPEVRPLFSTYGQITKNVADKLGLSEHVKITYKAGDQPNNALSLNVLEPGEVAATAGTSGVVYAVTDQIRYDKYSRVNTFAHVNHQSVNNENRLGVLLCINGTGILNRWVKDNFGTNLTYHEMNLMADKVQIGSNGLALLPFGNGAERVLRNKAIGASVNKLDFNIHNRSHVFRAAQEGIAFSLKYGMDIMAESGTNPSVIRAGKANMFLSNVFAKTLVNSTGVSVELFDTDGAKGAAIGAGIGIGVFKNAKDAFVNMKKIEVVEPNLKNKSATDEAYANWKIELEKSLIL